MATIKNLITIGEKSYHVMDGDPSVGGGTPGVLGDLAVYDNGTTAHMFIKTGAADTAWDMLSTAAGSGFVDPGTAGKLSLYPATGNTVGDTYVQNSQNISLTIAAQGTRSAGLSYVFPNPGDAITSADVVLTEGSQTINGTKTFGSAIAMGTNKIAGMGNPTLAQDAATKFYVDAGISGVTSALANYLPLAGGTMSGAIAMGANQITGLADPTAAQHAATKQYVDSVAQGLKPKQAARAATTANIVIATALNAGDIIDGVTLSAGNRVLVKDQTAAEENGIYIVGASPSRATDFDAITPIDEINGAMVPVQEGTANAGKVFVQYGTVATVGVDPINFTVFNDLSTLIGGDMITVSGSTISVDLSSSGGLVSTNPGNPGGQLSIKLNVAGAVVTDASGVAVSVDNSTIEIAANALQLKALGITDSHISGSAAIAFSKMAALTASKLLVSDGTGVVSVSSGSGFVKAVSGAPSYQASISLTADVSGILPVANGGTNSSTALTGKQIMVSNSGATAIVEAGAMTDGQLLIGSTGAQPVIATLSAGTNAGVTIANAAGSITLSTVQDIRTSASPSFTGLTISGLTAGSVPFAGAGGAITQDNANFFFDDTNNRLGLGNAAPARTLDVAGNAIVHGPFKLQDATATKANMEWLQAEVSTTDATVTNLVTLSVPSGKSILVEARIIGARTGGSAGSAGDSATYVRTARFKNVGGTITIHNLQSDYTSEDQAAWNGSLVIDAGAAKVQVSGAANNNIDWTVTYSVITL
jgi:hypothetical protein